MLLFFFDRYLTDAFLLASLRRSLRSSSRSDAAVAEPDALVQLDGGRSIAIAAAAETTPLPPSAAFASRPHPSAPGGVRPNPSAPVVCPSEPKPESRMPLPWSETVSEWTDKVSASSEPSSDG